MYSCLAGAQTLTRAQLVGTWIGVHTDWDINSFCPLPTYMRLAADSTYQFGLIDEREEPIRSTWTFQAGIVRLDTIHYAPGLVTQQNDLLRIGKLAPMTFRRFADIPIDSVTAVQQLSNRVWRSDSLTIHLHAEGQACLEHTQTGKRTVHHWALAKQDASLFLVVRGNSVNKQGNYAALWQISKLSRQQVQLIGWNGHTVSTEPFLLTQTLAAGSACTPTTFQPCDNCLGVSPLQTMRDGAGLLTTVRHVFQQQYHPVTNAEQSGLLWMTFTVNCGGEFGRFDYKGLDENYHAKCFDQRLINQFLTICRDNLAQDLASHIADAQPRDTIISVMFRLKNGTITDVF